MLNYAIGAAIVAAPLILKSSPTIVIPLGHDFYLMLMTMLGLLFFGAKIHLENKIIGLLIAIAAFQSNQPFSLFHLYQFTMSIIGCLLMINLNSIAPKNIKTIYFSLSAICLIQSFWVILNYFDVDPYHVYLELTGTKIKKLATNGANWVEPAQAIKNLTGSVGNNNHAGAIIAVTIPFLKPYLWVLPIIALAIGGSALPVVTAAFTIAIYFSYKKDIKIIRLSAFFGAGLLAAATLIGLLKHIAYFSDSDRVKMWFSFIDFYGIQFLGKGFGTVPMDFAEYYKASQRFNQAHNELLEAYSVGGIVAIAGLFYALKCVTKDIGLPAITACLLGLLLNSLGNFTFHVAPLFLIFSICYSIQLTRSKEDGTSCIR